MLGSYARTAERRGQRASSPLVRLLAPRSQKSVQARCSASSQRRRACARLDRAGRLHADAPARLFWQAEARYLSPRAHTGIHLATQDRCHTPPHSRRPAERGRRRRIKPPEGVRVENASAEDSTGAQLPRHGFGTVLAASSSFSAGLNAWHPVKQLQAHLNAYSRCSLPDRKF